MKRINKIKLASAIALVATCFSAQHLNAQTAKKFSTGCFFDPAIHAKLPKSAPQLTRTMANLPATVSLKTFCPSPKNQTPYNTCVGWSTAYAARTIMESIALGRSSQPETDKAAFSPSFVYNQIRKNNSCTSPAYIHEAIELIINQGCAKLSEFPFDCENTVDDNIMEKASKYRITGYKALTPYKDLGFDIVKIMKKSLSQKNPIVIALRCYDSFFDVTGDVWNGVEDVDNGFHAITVIGYDDQKEGGSFEIMNSWGPGWGNKGFCWIKYADMAKNAEAAYEMIGELNTTATAEKGKTLRKGTFRVQALDGKVRFKKDSGEDMAADFDPVLKMYKMRYPYKSGTKFQLNLANSSAAYVYALSSDLNQNVSQVFPHRADVSPALNYSDSEVAIPSESAFFKMDNVPGSDYLCVLYSKVPINTEELLQKIAKMDKSESFYKKIQTALATRMVDQSTVIYGRSGEISINAHPNKVDDVFVLMTELTHIK